MGFGASVGCFDDQGDVGASQARHIEFEVNAAVTPSVGGIFMGFGGTIDASGNAGVLDSSAFLFVVDGNMERGPLAG
jgi:hypothetical protein